MKDRKNEIIQATLELAAESGLGTVSMQKIADKVGITKASLYNHFSSKDEIVEAIYEKLRKASREKLLIESPNYDNLTEDKTLRVILTDAIYSYRKIVNNPQMVLFYQIIMNERTIKKAAAEIIVRETKTMIDATKTLFYVLQAKGIANFGNVDAAAFSFAMGVHAILEYEYDLEHTGMERNRTMMQGYIEEFSRIYGIRGEKQNDE